MKRKLILTISLLTLLVNTATSRANEEELKDLKLGFQLCTSANRTCQDSLQQSSKVINAQEDQLKSLVKENNDLRSGGIFKSPFFYLGLGIVGGVLISK